MAVPLRVSAYVPGDGLVVGRTTSAYCVPAVIVAGVANVAEWNPEDPLLKPVIVAEARSAPVGRPLLVARRDREPADRIAIRHGSRVVRARAVVPEERWVTEVDDVDDLARIADTYDRVILHVTEDGEDVYLVDDGIAVYRYRHRHARRAAGPLPSGTW